jgi:hypothetical protein
MSSPLVRSWSCSSNPLTDGNELIINTHRSHSAPQKDFLTLITAGAYVNPRATVRLEALGKLKNSMTSLGLESATFRLVCNASKKYATSCPYNAQHKNNIIENRSNYEKWNETVYYAWVYTQSSTIVQGQVCLVMSKHISVRPPVQTLLSHISSLFILYWSPCCTCLLNEIYQRALSNAGRGPLLATARHWYRMSHGFHVDGEGSDEASHSLSPP